MSIKSVTMENKQDGHFKEYRLSLDDAGGGVFEVVALWGKIGTSLTRTVKFSGDQAKAEKQFAKILIGQQNKGYLIVGEKHDGQNATTTGSQAVAGVVKKVIARIPPMLCGALQDRAELEPYLLNDNMVLQEKFNGVRKEIMKGSDGLSITNKQGQPTSKGMLPTTQKEFLKVPFDFTVDTEDEPVGGGCVLLDILMLRNKPLERLVRRDRRPLLEAFYKDAGFDPKIVRLAEEAVGTVAKRAFLKRIEDEGGEGVIVKDNESIYWPGESGRKHCWKLKFQATVSVIVDEVLVSGKRSIAMVLLDGDKWVSVGKCAIPVNKEIPTKGSTAEIRYLFADPNSNKLNQPFFLGTRDDVAPNECQLSQLKYLQSL